MTALFYLCSHRRKTEVFFRTCCALFGNHSISNLNPVNVISLNHITSEEVVIERFCEMAYHFNGINIHIWVVISTSATVVIM
jgi:hypothetical protein